MLPPPSRLSLPSVVLWLAWRSYLRKLQVDPLLTKSITAAVLSVLSEVAAKRLNNLPLKSSTAIHELTIGLVLRCRQAATRSIRVRPHVHVALLLCAWLERGSQSVMHHKKTQKGPLPNHEEQLGAVAACQSR
ncbi:unnamed protein product [Agarophyton chilense]